MEHRKIHLPIKEETENELENLEGSSEEDNRKIHLPIVELIFDESKNITLLNLAQAAKENQDGAYTNEIVKSQNNTNSQNEARKLHLPIKEEDCSKSDLENLIKNVHNTEATNYYIVENNFATKQEVSYENSDNSDYKHRKKSTIEENVFINKNNQPLLNAEQIKKENLEKDHVESCDISKKNENIRSTHDKDICQTLQNSTSERNLMERNQRIEPIINEDDIKKETTVEITLDDLTECNMFVETEHYVDKTLCSDLADANVLEKNINSGIEKNISSNKLRQMSKNNQKENIKLREKNICKTLEQNLENNQEKNEKDNNTIQIENTVEIKLDDLRECIRPVQIEDGNFIVKKTQILCNGDEKSTESPKNLTEKNQANEICLSNNIKKENTIEITLDDVTECNTSLQNQSENNPPNQKETKIISNKLDQVKLKKIRENKIINANIEQNRIEISVPNTKHTKNDNEYSFEGDLSKEHILNTSLEIKDEEENNMSFETSESFTITNNNTPICNQNSAQNDGDVLTKNEQRKKDEQPKNKQNMNKIFKDFKIFTYLLNISDKVRERDEMRSIDAEKNVSEVTKMIQSENQIPQELIDLTTDMHGEKQSKTTETFKEEEISIEETKILAPTTQTFMWKNSSTKRKSPNRIKNYFKPVQQQRTKKSVDAENFSTSKNNNYKNEYQKHYKQVNNFKSSFKPTEPRLKSNVNSAENLGIKTQHSVTILTENSFKKLNHSLQNHNNANKFSNSPNRNYPSSIECTSDILLNTSIHIKESDSENDVSFETVEKINSSNINRPPIHNDVSLERVCNESNKENSYLNSKIVQNPYLNLTKCNQNIYILTPIYVKPASELFLVKNTNPNDVISNTVEDPILIEESDEENYMSFETIKQNHNTNISKLVQPMHITSTNQFYPKNINLNHIILNTSNTTICIDKSASEGDSSLKTIEKNENSDNSKLIRNKESLQKPIHVTLTSDLTSNTVNESIRLEEIASGNNLKNQNSNNGKVIQNKESLQTLVNTTSASHFFPKNINSNNIFLNIVDDPIRIEENVTENKKSFENIETNQNSDINKLIQIKESSQKPHLNLTQNNNCNENVCKTNNEPNKKINIITSITIKSASQFPDKNLKSNNVIADNISNQEIHSSISTNEKVQELGQLDLRKESEKHSEKIYHFRNTREEKEATSLISRKNCNNLSLKETSVSKQNQPENKSMITQDVENGNKKEFRSFQDLQQSNLEIEEGGEIKINGDIYIRIKSGYQLKKSIKNTLYTSNHIKQNIIKNLYFHSPISTDKEKEATSLIFKKNGNDSSLKGTSLNKQNQSENKSMIVQDFENGNKKEFKSFQDLQDANLEIQEGEEIKVNGHIYIRIKTGYQLEKPIKQQKKVEVGGARYNSLKIIKNLNVKNLKIFKEKEIVETMTSEEVEDKIAIKCDKCDFKTLKGKKDLILHSVVHRPKAKLFECSFCPFKGTCQNYFKKHLNGHTEKDTDNLDPMLKCVTCSYKTKDKSNLKKHLRVHFTDEEKSALPDLKCDQCDYVTKFQDQLTVHKKKHKDFGEITFYKCEDCSYFSKGKEFLKAHRLQNHTNEITEDMILKCDKCLFTTLDKCKLRIHVRRHRPDFHNGGRPSDELMLCNDCSFSTKFRMSLTKHIKLVHGEKKYKCMYCDFKSSKGSVLKGHLLRHMDPSECELFGCYRCDYKSKIKSDLVDHVTKNHHKKKKVHS